MSVETSTTPSLNNNTTTTTTTTTTSPTTTTTSSSSSGGGQSSSNNNNNKQNNYLTSSNHHHPPAPPPHHHRHHSLHKTTTAPVPPPPPPVLTKINSTNQLPPPPQLLPPPPPPHNTTALINLTNSSSPLTATTTTITNHSTTNSSSSSSSILVVSSSPNSNLKQQKSTHQNNQNKSNLQNILLVDKQLASNTATNLTLDDQIKADSEVTALHTYKGRADEHELSFDYGDVIKIIKIVPKDPQWALAELKGKQGYIALNYVKPKSVTMPWFHVHLTREQAEFLLKDLAEGSYLMRESTHYPGDFTLCLKSESKVENYHIKQINEKYTIDDENMFKNLIELIDFYTKIDDLACRLKEPVKYVKKKENSDYQTILNSFLINESEVSLGKEIGIGEFGAVYRGIYKNNEVAVKKIKDRTTVDEFLKEAYVMATLSHPNLVKLIGVVKHMSNGVNEISLVTEFMPKGSLLDYLMSRGRNVLTKKELLDFVINICSGMSYLEEKGIVHRDLAASNVLISKENIAKVSDFGLAKKIMDDCKNGVRIRIKWTAPEAIKDRLYSNKSDMWSFGILLWEIFSYGRTPYPKIPVNEVLSYIEQGYQMEKPDGCPDDIYSLMKDAWEYDRTLRPTFSNSINKLNKMKTKILES